MMKQRHAAALKFCRAYLLVLLCARSAAALFIFALSAAGAIFLISELSRPFQEMMQISSAPLRNALVPLSP